MKKTLLLIAFICYTITAFTQVIETEKKVTTQSTDSIEGWKKGGTIGLHLSQTSLTNWAAGGQNSMSVSGLFNGFLNYKKGENIWENYLDIGYGSIKQDGNTEWWKTDDKIDFMSKYGRKAFKKWYYAALFNFKTQMANGYKYPNDSTVISGLFAPGYFLGAIGMNYKSKNFTVFIAPLTAKFTIVNDQNLADMGAFGVDSATHDISGTKLTDGENLKKELGGYIRMFYQKELMKNIDLQTKLDLFSNYLENPQNIDVSWEVLISMKVNKFISATLSTHLLYDDDIKIGKDTNDDGVNDHFSSRIQFKEVLSAGLTFKF